MWDEGMAERAARYLREHPDRQMVVLAGSGHLEFGDGIPKRLMRRLPVETVIVINGLRPDLDPSVADYLLLPEARDLPPHGLLGVMLETEGDGVSVKGFGTGSRAEEAGMRKGDRILRIGGQKVSSYTDVRFALIDRSPGENVQVDIVRDRVFLGETEMSYEVKLQ